MSAGTLKSDQRDLYARIAVTSAADLVERVEAMADSVTFDLARHRRRVRCPVRARPWASVTLPIVSMIGACS